MAFNRAIKAGKAFVEFVLDDKKLQSGIHTLSGASRKVGKIGLASSGAILAGFTAASLAFASAGSALDDMSKRTSLSVESLSELSFAAEQTGTNIAAVERATKELQKKGINPRRFDEIADSIAAIPDPTKRAQAAMEAFGKRSGTALLPLLKELPALRAEARQLGIVMSTEDARAAEKLGNALDATRAQVMAIGLQIGAAVAGPLTEFLINMQDVLANVIGWIKENKQLVQGIAAVTLGIAAASAAAVTFGVILAVISAHPIIAALTAISGLVLGLAVYFGLATNSAGSFKRQLDGIKVPGATSNASLTASAAATQANLRSALRGGSPNLAPSANARFGNSLRRSGDPILAELQAHTVWLRKIWTDNRGLAGGAF